MRIMRLPVVGLLVVVLHGCGLNPPGNPDAKLNLDFNIGVAPRPPGASAPAFFAEESVFESIPDKTGHHAATIIAFDDGELLAAWYSYQGEHELNGSAIYTARKPAGGAWEPPRLHVDRPRGDGNPVLYRQGDRVWLFQAVVPFGWSTGHIEFQISEDRGRTWSPPAVLSPALGSNTRYPPIRLHDGTLLLPAYDDLFDRSLFFASSDGSSWTFRSAVSSRPGNLQPSLVQLDTGRVLSVLRNKQNGWLWVMASDDGGKTWSIPRDSRFPNPASAALLLQLTGGNLVLIFNDSPTERKPLSITLSGDAGRTWMRPRILADGDSTYSYPSAVQSPDGLIHIVYSRGREAIRHVVLNEAWIVAE